MQRNLVFTSLLLVPLLVRAEEWPEFRGPTGQGHSAATGLPLKWSETEQVAWKAAVPGLGWSSPAIVGQQIWLTTALEGGKSLRAICLDERTGKLIHNVEVFQKDDPGRIHNKNSHASPTPIIDGDRVYVHFGAHGTGCVSTQGKLIWQINELKYDHVHGPGGSPVLYQDLLLISCDGNETAFVVALDKKTGKIRWQKDRNLRMAFSTPLVINVNGEDLLISTGGEEMVAYRPLTGDEVWKARYGTGYSLIPRPVYGHGLLFICTGYNTPQVLAIRPDGTGDVTDTHIVWSRDRGAPHSPSPILVGDELYIVSDRGIATCLDARTGKEHWQQRVEGNYSASPLFADGRIYLLNEAGVTTVFAPGTKPKVLATNTLDGRTLASFGVHGKALFLRTDTHLYRLEETR